MRSTADVKKLIEAQQLEEAETLLAQAQTLADLPQADWHYLKGLIHSKRGNWAEAKSQFLQATQLSPQHPAAEALGVLTDIYDFYYKDLLNP